MRSLWADVLLEILSHQGKSLLTAFAISVGVMSIVGVAIESKFSESAVKATSEQQTGRSVTVGVEIEPTALSSQSISDLTSSLNHRVGNDETSNWLVSLDLSTEIEVSDPQSGSPIPSTKVNLISGSLGSARRLPIVAGDSTLDSRASNWAYLNLAAAEQMSTSTQTVMLRRTIQESGAFFNVRGVLDDGDPAPKVYADLRSYNRYDPATVSRTLASISAHGESIPPETLSQNLSTAILETDLQPIGSISRIDGTDQLEVGTKSVQRGFAFASVVTFIVAAVGTANVGLSSVRERRREFAIRRAVGFTQRRIALTVLTVQIAIGLTTSVASVALCGVFAYGLLPGLSTNPLVERPAFPWSMASLAIAAGVIAALLGAIAPSLSAARTSIISVLR